MALDEVLFVSVIHAIPRTALSCSFCIFTISSPFQNFNNNVALKFIWLSNHAKILIMSVFHKH
mgnify:CR=1 FL=1